MNDRAELRADVDTAKGAVSKINRDIAAAEDQLVNILAARLPRLFTELSELTAVASLLIETRKRRQG